MGKFKDESIYLPIDAFLILNGFAEIANPRNRKGLSKVYKNPGKSNEVWVTFDLESKSLYVYKSTGLMFLAETTIKIYPDWLTDMHTFVDKVDKELIPWIG